MTCLPVYPPMAVDTEKAKIKPKILNENRLMINDGRFEICDLKKSKRFIKMSENQSRRDCILIAKEKRLPQNPLGILL